jgi:hypothetical protein
MMRGFYFRLTHGGEALWWWGTRREEAAAHCSGTVALISVARRPERCRRDGGVAAGPRRPGGQGTTVGGKDAATGGATKGAG